MLKLRIMKKIVCLILLLLTVFTGLSLAQDKKVWTLQDCIIYALENNIQIKQQDILTDYQKNALDLARFRLLPTINGQASHNYSFGRALDQTTYEYTDNETIVSDNFYMSANLLLFNGLQNLNAIKRSKYDLLASEEDLKNIKDNVALNVALAYLQILLNREIMVATENQLNTTKEQIEKSRKLVDAGSVARGNLLQIEAQAAQEELQLISSRNRYDLSLLDITQFLELPSPEGFSIVIPEIPLDTNTVIQGNIAETYQTALASRPEVKGSEYRLSSDEYDLRIAKGTRSPRLTMNNSFSTGFSDIRKKLLGIDENGPVYGKYPFAEQINDNINYGIGLSLNIPILNGWQVNKNIANAKLSVQSGIYALEGTKKQLYKNIQQAYADAEAALKRYASSLKAVTSTEESFRYTEERFNVGMITPVDYNAAKTQLLNAQSEMAQAKYEYIFKTKVLDFYRGIPLNLNQK